MTTRAGRHAIRPARPDELGRLGPLYEEAGFGARLAGVVGFARARLDGEVVVAEADGELVGVAAGAIFAGTGWVGGVAVVPAHRRAGLALLDAVRAGPGDEVAISVPAANPTAVGSLQSAGFSERYRTVRMHRGPRIPWDPAALFAAHNLFWG